MKQPALKTLLLSDQHMKSAALVNWIASHQSAQLKRLNFSVAGSSDDHVVDYVDINAAGGAHRVIAGKITTLHQPLFLPIAHGAQKVVLLLSSLKKDLIKDFAERTLKEKGVLGAQPEVIFVYWPGPKDPPVDLAAWFGKTDGIRHPKMDVGDYSSIWEEISPAPKAEVIAVAAKKGDASVILRPVEAPVDARHADVAVLARKAEVSTLPKKAEVPAASKKAEVSAVPKKAEVVSLAKNADVPVSAKKLEVPVVAKQAEAAKKVENKLKQTEGNMTMANAAETLAQLMQIDGAVGGLIGDYTSGMVLAKAGGGVNLDVAAAGNSEVIKSKMKTMAALGIKESIEDILITLGTQYHVIRPIPIRAGLFLYLVLDKAKANLAMARFKVAEVEKGLTL